MNSALSQRSVILVISPLDSLIVKQVSQHRNPGVSAAILPGNKDVDKGPSLDGQTIDSIYGQTLPAARGLIGGWSEKRGEGLGRVWRLLKGIRGMAQWNAIIEVGGGWTRRNLT